MFDSDFNPAHQLQTLPVIEGERAAGKDAQQLTAKDAFGSKLRLERFLLLEVLKDFDL